MSASMTGDARLHAGVRDTWCDCKSSVSINIGDAQANYASISLGWHRHNASIIGKVFVQTKLYPLALSGYEILSKSTGIILIKVITGKLHTLPTATDIVNIIS